MLVREQDSVRLKIALAGHPPPLLRDILHTSRLPERVKVYLRKDLEARR